MSIFLQDLRYALRVLVKAPGLTLAALLAIGLGVGATTMIFSVVNAVLLRPLPYPEPERLVMVWQDFRARGGPEKEWASPAGFLDWRAQHEVFEHLTAITGWAPNLTASGEPEQLRGATVTANYFDTLGVAPALGRTFRAEEDVPNAPRVAVLADGLWQRRFGRDPAIVGRSISLNGEAFTVIGVMPPFRPAIVTNAEIWTPLRLNPQTASRGSITLQVVGRLRSGMTLATAQARMNVLAQQLEQQYPRTNTRTGLLVSPLHEEVVGDVRRALIVMLGAVGFVLLIACTNVANLLLARASTRGREMAVRLALGASRRRVIRQLLTESLLLAAAGGVIGVLLSVWGVDGLIALSPASAPRLDEIGIDATVLAFAVGLSLATGLLFGLAPALHGSRADLSLSLKDGGRGTAGAGGRHTRRVLVIAEMAVALVLLVGAGLLLRSFIRLLAVDAGFDPAHVVTATLSTPASKYPEVPQARAFYEQLIDRVKGLPGVEAAGVTSSLPMSGGDTDVSFEIEGRPAPGDGNDQVVWYRIVSPDYFKAMGMRLTSGRLLADTDRNEAAAVVVINETMARRYWPKGDAVGAHLRTGANRPWYTVVGITADVKHRGPRSENLVQMYVPLNQQFQRRLSVVVRTAAPLSTMAALLRDTVRSLDPDLPLANITTMEALLSDNVAQPRFLTWLVGLFAVAAAALAALGIYGVMSYSVSQRTGEIGVRLALGAAPSDVFRLIALDGLRLAGLGVLAGLAGALAVTRLLDTLLFGVKPTDPLTFAVTAIALTLVALGASLVPARRAVRVDPLEALRVD